MAADVKKKIVEVDVKTQKIGGEQAFRKKPLVSSLSPDEKL